MPNAEASKRGSERPGQRHLGKRTGESIQKNDLVGSERSRSELSKILAEWPGQDEPTRSSKSSRQTRDCGSKNVSKLKRSKTDSSKSERANPSNKAKLPKQFTLLASSGLSGRS